MCVYRYKIVSVDVYVASGLCKTYLLMTKYLLKGSLSWTSLGCLDVGGARL